MRKLCCDISVVLNYLKYIFTHKWYVLVECCKLGIPFLGVVHDFSKLSHYEFSAYMNNFTRPRITKIYPGESDKIKFNYAWLHHQKANKHHWQYWILVYDNDKQNIKALEIPDRYRRELFADWIGANKAINNGECKINEWYNKNRHNIILHPKTREWIESKLEQQ